MKGFCRLGSLCASSLALLVAGCSTSNLPNPGASVTGNWAFTTQANASKLTLNAGLSSQVDGAVSAVAHLSGAACIPSTTAIVLNGSVDENGRLTLTSNPFAGTTLKVAGQVATDGKSISDTTLTFDGGSCSNLGAMAASTTQYAQINGTYAGTFYDNNNNQLPVTAQLTQTTQPDANGQFHLSGSATFPNNPCFTQPIVTDSLVTGSSLSATYTQGNATITAVGTFNSDATQLTISNFTVQGGLCNGDAGTGLLTEQQ